MVLREALEHLLGAPHALQALPDAELGDALGEVVPQALRGLQAQLQLLQGLLELALGLSSSAKRWYTRMRLLYALDASTWFSLESAISMCASWYWIAFCVSCMLS